MISWNLDLAPNGVDSIAEVAGAISELAGRCCNSLPTGKALVPIWELSACLPSAGRSVIQMRPSAEFFDAFFNSSVGYRAMFRRGPRVGCAANAMIVEAIQSALSKVLSKSIQVHMIKPNDDGLEHAGHQEMDSSNFLRSLDPSLSKVWYATAEIGEDCNIRSLPFGVSTDKIDVGLPNHWAAIYQDAEDCVLEVKGAFVGPCGLFQVKDPQQRAKTLSESGEA